MFQSTSVEWRQPAERILQFLGNAQIELCKMKEEIFKMKESRQQHQGRGLLDDWRSGTHQLPISFVAVQRCVDTPAFSISIFLSHSPWTLQN